MNEIEKIKERNARVEVDKAWETSLTRKVVIAIATYFVIGIWLQMINAPDPWVNAIVPSAAFVLSTLTLPFIKNLWVKYIYKR
jgi:hypothetical protein